MPTTLTFLGVIRGNLPMTILLDGKAVAKYLFHPEPISSNKVIYRDISKKLSEKLTLAKQLLGDGFTPHLDIIHVNRQTESQLYIRKKMEAFRQVITIKI